MRRSRKEIHLQTGLEQKMNTRKASSIAAILGPVAAALLLAAPAARAQTATTITPAVRGLVTATGAESVACAGTVTVTTRAVTVGQVVVDINVSGVSCIGTTSRAAYANTGYARLTRPLVPQDVIQTTLAVYRDTAAGRLAARTALLTLNLTYNVTTGAVSGGTGGIGNL
jgi:hypothetical protein